MFVTRRRAAPILAALGAGLLASTALTAQAGNFNITNLVSDGSVPAVTVDPALINPWGMSYTPTGPFWVSDNNWGTSTLYNGNGSKVALTVTIPPPPHKTGIGTPTGQVYNPSSQNFLVTSNGKTGAAAFIFDAEDGTITGWAPTVDETNAILAVNNAKERAVYKGLAIGTKGTKTFLYATNFRAGDVEIYDTKFKLVKTFTDTTVPAGYAPYNVQNIGGTLYVTFAKQNKAKHDSVSGPGFGYVDAFSLSGAMLRRVTSQGPLNAPWGLDIAPAGFGSFAGDLLVGNFGDGWINAFDVKTGAYKGALTNSSGAPIAIVSLWGLINGNGGSGGDAGTVYFSAGLANEAHGLFGSLTPIAAKASVR
jgi:uncharacterized protein (TIGR03118 family)